MKNAIKLAPIFLVLWTYNLTSVSASAAGRFQRESGGSREREGRSPSIFPRYPVSQQVRGRSPAPPARIPAHPDSLGNRVTQDHLSRVEFAHGRAENVMKRDFRVTNVVSVGRAHFVNHYRPEFEHRSVTFNNYISHYNTVVVSNPVFLDVWHRHHFFGGFYYGFHPILEIDTYFYNPMVYWFYVPTMDEYYYRNWYKERYDAYPELHRPFEYHGLYYPTENLRQLLFGVSAMPTEKQARFRTSISVFTKRLAQKMANGLDTHVQLSSGDIAVTHYEIIGYDDAINMEGVVTFRGTAYNFKGLVDLENPDKSDVFVPATWDKNPTPEQLANLDALNARIAAIKGEPMQPLTEVPQDATASPASTPGQVTADPER